MAKTFSELSIYPINTGTKFNWQVYQENSN